MPIRTFRGGEYLPGAQDYGAKLVGAPSHLWPLPPGEDFTWHGPGHLGKG